MKLSKNFKRALLTSGALALALTACDGTLLPPNLIGDTAVPEDADFVGKVTKDGSEPGINATVVVIQDGKDVGITRTNGAGEYGFADVKSGDTRVAFLLQSEAEREEGDVLYYEGPDDKTGQFYGFVTTNTFDYSSGEMFTVPTFNVAWDSDLSPHNTTVSVDSPIKFSWGSAENADKYSINIYEGEGKTQVHSFSGLSSAATEFTWNNPREKLSAGKTYTYNVSVTFRESSAKIHLTSGGSARAKFTTD